MLQGTITYCLHPTNEVDIGFAGQAGLVLKVPEDVVGGATAVMRVQLAVTKRMQ